MINDTRKKYFYFFVLCILISGAVGDELIYIFSIASIFITIFTILSLASKHSYSPTALATLFVSAFVFLFVFTSYGIVLQDRFSGGADFDSSGTATIKFVVKCLIIVAFFPVPVKLETGIADVCKIVLIYTGVQAIFTSIIINILGFPIEVTNHLFPLIGGVADWEPSPLFVLAPSLDFTYYRPRFIFREPQGLGYFIIVVYFIYTMLINSVSKKLMIFVFFMLLIIIAKAALIVFVIYMITFWTATKLQNKRVLMSGFLALTVIITFSIIFYFLGDYILSRVSGLLLYNISDLGFMPLGINSALWLGFEKNSSLDISYFTIFYELGIIISFLYIISLIYLFIKIIRIRTKEFISLFPIYVSFLIFLASGSTYSSGGGILIMYYLHVLSSRSIASRLSAIKYTHP